MVDSTEETGLGQAIGRAEVDRGFKSKPSASQPRVLPSKKPKSKLRAWIERQKIGFKLWLYHRAVLVGLSFLGLNAIDTYAQLTPMLKG
jgi:hypothetical protein